MLKYTLFTILFAKLLFANTISTLVGVTPLNSPFVIKATVNTFDDSITYTHKPLLKCLPQLDAVYKVESPTRLKVIPKKQLHASTKYECHYNKENFSFSTNNFSLLNVDFFKHNKMFRLTFNDEIDTKTIQKALKITKLNKMTKTELHYSVVSSEGQYLVLQIDEKIEQYPLKLTINKKLKTKFGKLFTKSYSNTFNEPQKIDLDSNRKRLTLKDSPQMVALENGQFALRIFVNDDLIGNSRDAIAIEGIDDFKVGENRYINYETRKKYNIKDSYYYHDVTSSEFKPNHRYNVTLKRGLKTYYRELKEDKHYTLITGERKESIMFDKEKPYISNRGEFSFSSVNVNHATLVVERVLDDNLRYFMNFNGANRDSLDSYTKEIFTKKLILNNKKNVITKQKFKLSDLSKNALPVGVYKITLHFNKEDNEKFTTTTLFLSNLGIAVNVGKEEAFVSILTLDKAQPVKSATVEIYGANNALLGRATTNTKGVAIIHNPKLLKSSPKGVIVRTKDDRNFLALTQNVSGATPYKILETEERFKAFVYFQSNIVRPKSKIHALITVKDRDFISASKLPIKVVLKDSHGATVYKKIYHTDNYGLVDFSYQLGVNDKTGDHYLRVYMGNKQIGYKKIKVEAFMPPKIENHIATDKTIYRTNEIMDINISSSYLFGAPSSNLSGKVSFMARPIDYHNKAYKEYTFSNHHLNEEAIDSYLNHTEDILLDNKGEFELLFPAHIQGKVPSILETMIGVTVMDDAQPVSTYKKVKIFPYNAMVGLKIGATSLEKGQKLKGKAVLIDPITSKEIDRKLYVHIKKIEWHYNYSNGNYNWTKEITEVESFTIHSNENFSRKINDNGDFIVEVNDLIGGHSASIDFNVWWWNYTSISPKNDLKSLDIHFKNRLYKQGDTIDVEVKSPILEGQLLLTLEGSRVGNYKLIPIHKGVAKGSITIKQKLKRGLYLHAIAFRATNTESTLIPFRAMGYKFIKPNREKHKIDIKLNLPKTAQSKTNLKIEVKTSKPSKVLISIVDRGILQLINQKEPKIFNFFNEKSKQSLSYYDLYDQLLCHIAKGKLVDFGAGDLLNKRQKHLAPEFGKWIKPFMIWSGIVQSKNGVAKIEINIPEFNGRASVVAIALNSNSVGVTSQDITIKDDVMIKPSYPRYILKGDTIEVPIRLFNTTAHPKTVELLATTSPNLHFKLSKNTLVVKPNSSTLLTAQLKSSKIGDGNITLTATYGAKQVTKSAELPTFSPYALATKSFRGVTNKPKTITLPKGYEDARLFITLSDNPIGALRDELNYLISYPYGCAEQTSSKLTAMHYAEPFLDDKNLDRERKHFILEGIKKLDNMQNYYGEFTYWQGGKKVHAYASLYASETLLDLAQDGAEVKNDFKKKIIKMLKNVVNKTGNYSGYYTNFHRVYAGYILAQNGALPISMANMLYEKGIYKGHFLATYYMSAILKMQGEKEKAKKLFNDNSYDLSRYSYKIYSDTTGDFESNVRDMMLHFIVKTKYFNKDSRDLEKIKNEFSHLYSTQSKAMALKAVSIYLGKPKKSKMDVTLTVNNQTKNYTHSDVLMLNHITNSSVTINPHGSNLSYNLELLYNEEKPLYNQLSTKEPLSIQRQFIDENGNEVNLKKLKRGDRLFSKVTVVNYGKIDHVVVNQRIPACFEIVNNNIKEKKALFKDENIAFEHKEIRDDRVLSFINLPRKRRWDSYKNSYYNIENRGVFYTPLLASSVGECKLPALITEAMYDTRIKAYAKGAKEVIVDRLKNYKKVKKVVKEVAPKNKHLNMINTQAQELVKEIYTKEMNSNNPNEFIQFFKFPLNIYFRTKNFKKEELLKDKREYFKKWSKRIYSNIKTEVIKASSITKLSKQIEVKISFDYTLYNGKKRLKGRSNHLITLTAQNHKLLVTSIELWKAPKTKKAKILTKESAEALVREIYTKEMSSTNPIEFADYFSYPLKHYFGRENVTKEMLLTDKTDYFKDWATRSYDNIKTDIIKESRDEIEVKITFNYTISNGKKSLKGVSNHLLTIIEEKGKLVVSSIKLAK